MGFGLVITRIYERGENFQGVSPDPTKMSEACARLIFLGRKEFYPYPSVSV